jgi:hypothetical protein
VEQTHRECRFYATYTGVALPFNLVNSIEPEALSNRNTFIHAYYDANGKLMGFHKVVYGEVELTHRYRYHGNGTLKQAEIAMLDEDPVTLHFDEKGAQTHGV